MLPLAFVGLDLGGVLVCGVMVGGVFGIPVALVRALIARGNRVERFAETLFMALAGSFFVMFVLYLVGPKT